MSRTKGIIFSLFLILFFSHCKEKYSTYKEFVITAKNRLPCADTLLRDSVGGFDFSRITRPGSNGFYCTCEFEEKFRNKQTCVIFSGRVRSNFAQSVGSISFSGNGDNDNHCLIWRAAPLKCHITEENKWCAFRDSVIFPPTIDGKPLRSITAMVFMGGMPGEKLDVDTFKVWFKIKKR